MAMLTQHLIDEYEATVREFDTGATRDTDDGKIDPEGAMSPLVERRFCEYMQKHMVTSDGGLRTSDNWQRGIPLEAYMKSLKRHVLEAWGQHRRGLTGVAVDGYEMEEALCAIIFNAQGYLHEILKHL